MGCRMRTAWPTFAKALTARIKEAVDAPVTLGYPAKGFAREGVWVAGRGRVECDAGVSGWADRDESLTVELRIKADWTTEQWEDALDRAWEIEAAIDTALAADQTLGGVVERAWISAIDVEEAIPEKTVRQAGLTVTVSAVATVE